MEELLRDFSNIKITVDVSKLPSLKPRCVNKIRAEDPEAADVIEKCREFKTYNGEFKIQVKRIRNKFNICVTDKTENRFQFKEIDEMWIGCGKNFDYYDTMEPYYIGNSALFVKNGICLSVSSDVRQFSLQKGEKVERYISTVNDENKVSGFIETNLGFYALDSFNTRNGFLPKVFIRQERGDEYRFNLLRWSSTYPFGQVKKINFKILIPSSPTILSSSESEIKRQRDFKLKEWFTKK